MSEQRKVLVIGASGLSGSYCAARLKAAGWQVVGLSRGTADPILDGHIRADLRDGAKLAKALAGLTDLTDLMICTWSMQPTETENVRVNRLMLENLFRALPRAPLRHVGLVTGLKHYLGPFEAYASGKPYTPFLETQPRLPGDNFYYAQEDVVFAEADRRGFSWSVHRPHTMIGYVLGNAMNMAVTLAVYASICKETGRPFVFPGSPQQYNAVADVTDARILADQLLWAATTPDAANLPFNIVNGDVFRWIWLWQRIADYFRLEAAPYPDGPTPLQRQMADAGQTWEKIVGKHGLRNYPVEKLASWWHSDADLGREVECFTDMTNSRVRGFTSYRSTPQSFFDVFDRLRAERIIPA